MREIVYIIHHHIIAKVGTDDRTVIQSNCHFEIVELKTVGFEFTDTNQSVKLTVLYQLRIERIRYQ